MPDNAFDLYPKAPGANPLVLSDPAKAIGLLNALQQNQLLGLDVESKRGLAEAYKGVIGPDGKVDENALRQRAPMAGFRAPELFSTIQSQEIQRVEQETAKIKQAELSRGITNSMMGSLPPGLNGAQAEKWLLRESTNYHPDLLPNRVLNGLFRDIRGLDADAMSAYIANATRQATGAPSLAAPDQEIKDQTGGREMLTRGGVIDRTIRPPGAPGAPAAPALRTGLPTGEEEILGSGAKQAAALVRTGETAPQMEADLSNLKRYSRDLGEFGGLTTDAELKLNTVAQRLGIEKITLGKDKVANAQAYNKLVEEYAARQQTQMSDAGLSSAKARTPSLMLSQLGRDAVIDAMHGNQDAINLARAEWLRAKKLGQELPQWREKLNKDLDVRVFQFNRMRPDAQQKFINTMTPEEAESFKKKFYETRDKGWLPNG